MKNLKNRIEVLEEQLEKKEQKATTPTSTKQSSVQDQYSITEQRYREHPSYEENETYDILHQSYQNFTNEGDMTHVF